MKVLVVEDDEVTAGFLVKGLREAGHVVESVGDGLEGLRRAMQGVYDVLVVDRMLPSLEGLTLIETLRKEKRETPVLILSALDDVDERVRGLRAGGDDYLTKPFAFSELLARLEVVARRRGAAAPATALHFADLEMDLLSRSVRRAGRELELKPREFLLLEYLMRHAGQVVTRTMLYEAVWDFNFDPQTNVIDVHISRLRQQVDRGAARALIHTVRGVGYALRED
jgi:two-component system OmpR family response regulator